jgi:hypothetical protein
MALLTGGVDDRDDAGEVVRLLCIGGASELPFAGLSEQKYSNQQFSSRYSA